MGILFWRKSAKDVCLRISAHLSTCGFVVEQREDKGRGEGAFWAHFPISDTQILSVGVSRAIRRPKGIDPLRGYGMWVSYHSKENGFWGKTTYFSLRHYVDGGGEALTGLIGPYNKLPQLGNG